MPAGKELALQAFHGSVYVSPACAVLSNRDFRAAILLVLDLVCQAASPTRCWLERGRENLQDLSECFRMFQNVSETVLPVALPMSFHPFFQSCILG